MIKKIKKRFDATSHMMLFGIGLAACYWVLESLLLLFEDTNRDLLQTLLQSDLSEISTRLIVLCLFVIFGSHAQYTINERKKALRRMERDAATRERFQRLLSPDLAELVVRNELKVEKGGQSRYATVMFADVCGFTRISEKYRAGEMLEMLNEYYELIVEIVFRNGGTLDKFLGDGIMVFWGAPVTRPNDPNRAVRSAMEMQAAITRFNHEREAAGRERLHFGIGINTGYLVAGYIGSSRTMSYSVIGDTVNTTYRLCTAAGEGQILISADTWDLVQDEFNASRLAPIQVKGKRQPLTVYEVHTPDP
jgi:adenylate cyclase